MRSQDSHKMSSSRVGWGQLSAQNSRPSTLCYDGDEIPRFSQDELQQSWLGSAVIPEFTSIHALLCTRNAGGPQGSGEVAQPYCRLLGPAEHRRRIHQFLLVY